jgi:hypothetical protein
MDGRTGSTLNVEMEEGIYNLLDFSPFSYNYCFVLFFRKVKIINYNSSSNNISFI